MLSLALFTGAHNVTHIATSECPFHLREKVVSKLNTPPLPSTYSVQNMGLVPLQVSCSGAKHHSQSDHGGERGLETGTVTPFFPERLMLAILLVLFTTVPSSRQVVTRAHRILRDRVLGPLRDVEAYAGCVQRASGYDQPPCG